ncbi:hypothetical protein SAMN06298216_2331 [Spirosomataceae bacterium TFI 002]|nr:hypothetical protein SAMN06298216_2331 [Spirosomataceae bacterium TFI 002]
MNSLLKKLNFKTQKSMLVLNSPLEFASHLSDFEMFLKVENEIKSQVIEFALIFATKQEEVDQIAPQIDKLIAEDGLFWFAYPKKSSKKYKCEFNRDNGWQVLGELGYEPVRMVAIDEDWSALRFRKAKNIKTLTRDPNWIMSKEGKKKAKK